MISSERLSVQVVILLSPFMFGPGMLQAQSLVSRDCSPILSNVSAGTISVTVKCDKESEDQLILRLANEQWTSKCGFSSPSKWYSSYDEANSTHTIAPAGTSYFARFNFQSTMSQTYLNYTESSKINNLDKNRGVFNFDGPMSAERKNYASAGKLSLRAQFQYEDGSNLEKGEATVMKNLSRGRYEVNAEMFDSSNAYPSEGDKIDGTLFSCEADTTMDVEVFKNLCKTVIEHTTVDDSFSHGSCESRSHTNTSEPE